ncbi:hypothetical protein PQ469_03020 [Mucilaginibacter sp. KACC 22773]|uniref:hypothetical protein n=1 Tax=Mucilaginibacter sp. KACC 22773 TaxID=3025671 RepID=UPI002366D639|nr:hypothetical protein [Mucilaginibacter sp. KACC 22773]WDF78976.1 hypothetical protein PQ469_03020 [Mucilaginibacter sp. KACC 22773]
MTWSRPLKEKVLRKWPIQKPRKIFFRSLKKGNSQQVTVERDGKEQKYFISANPQFKTVDVLDHQMKKIKREELLKPEQKQTTGKKQGEQQKEDAPAKSRLTSVK